MSEDRAASNGSTGGEALQRGKRPEDPYSVRVIAGKISAWIGRLGAVWLDGEVAQINVRSSSRTAFLTLRDTEANYSLPIVCSTDTLQAVPGELTEGARVIVHCRPEFYAQRGSFAMRAREIRQVGLGELLARIERLRQALEAEGLFAAARKKRLPFLPSCVGLVTGAGSAAEKDVLENARIRWPAVRFEVVHTAVQGHAAAYEVTRAVRRLDDRPHVEVIVIARGGGSVEDLLPFSDETLLRTVAAARTPIVSAIGHEPDTPLLDYVADLRASTPTDAAKRIIPDVAEEIDRIAAARERLRGAVQRRIDQGYALIEQLTSRPSLADPHAMIVGRREDIDRGRERIRRAMTHSLSMERSALHSLSARVVALSPTATLARGYAVLQRDDGHVVTSVAELSAGQALSARVTDGRADLTVNDVHGSAAPIESENP